MMQFQPLHLSPGQGKAQRDGQRLPLELTSPDPALCPQARYVQAKLSVHDRSLKVATVIESLEMEMELLCLTGVEDQLQTDVRPTLETLRNAGIKVCLRQGCPSRATEPLCSAWHWPTGSKFRDGGP